MNNNLIRRFFPQAVALTVVLVAIYLFSYAFDPQNWALYLTLGFFWTMGILGGVLLGAMLFKEAFEVYGEQSTVKDWVIYLIPTQLCFAAIAVLWIVALIPSSARAIFEIKGNVPEITEQRLPDLDLKNAPLVPEDLAIRKARAAMSTLGEKAAQLELGPMHKQEVNGKLVWVAFLEPAGLFKWASLDGSPGYVVVSASDYSEVKIVTSLEDKPLNLRYTQGAFFGESLSRHVWLNYSMTTKFGSFTSEIDDAGKPYYVAPILQYTPGGTSTKVNGLIVVDPQSGEISRYDQAQAPSWIDIVEPMSLVKKQIDAAGDLVNGRFNWSGVGKYGVSSIDQVYAKDGKSYWAVGVSSNASKDKVNGVQRFVFVDTRTGETAAYRVNGVLEERAKQIVVDSRPKAYESSNAVPFLVDGRPTYVMSLSLGDAIYGYGMVDIENETVFSTETTLDETFQSYLVARTNAGLSLSQNETEQALSGTVFRIGQDAKTGRYTLMLQGDRRMFVASSELSAQLAVTQPGDRVTLALRANTDRSASVVYFENTSLEIQ